MMIPAQQGRVMEPRTTPRPDRRAAEETCPICRADLQVKAGGAYLDCSDQTCGWIGWPSDFSPLRESRNEL